MDEQTTTCIDRCRREVAGHPKHEMTFVARRELLRSLGPQELDSLGHAVTLTSGKRRRTALAAAVARRVAHLWARDFGTGAIADLLDAIDGYLAGTTARDVVRKKADSLSGGLFNAPPEAKQEGYLAAHATAGAGWVAVSDELLFPDAGVTQEELDDPEDPDLWDPAFWAAGAAAGGHPWMAGFRPADYHAFWQWYLDVAVPSVADLG